MEYLDLTEYILYGWEFTKSLEVVHSILEGILCGDRFPPVEVTDSRNSGFVIANLTGGHHRSVAHSLARRPLPVTVVPSGRDFSLYLPVSQISLVSYPESWERLRGRRPYRVPTLSFPDVVCALRNGRN